MNKYFYLLLVCLSALTFCYKIKEIDEVNKGSNDSNAAATAGTVYSPTLGGEETILLNAMGYNPPNYFSAEPCTDNYSNLQLASVESGASL